MYEKSYFYLILIVLASITLASCSSESSEESSETLSEETSNQGENNEVLKIATSPAWLETAEKLEPIIEKMGYEVEVVGFNDVVQPNTALSEKQVNCTFHQHEPYLAAYNEEQGTDLHFCEPLLNEFQGLYSNKYNSNDEFPDNAKIGIYEDLSNQHRTLLFAQEIGLITLEDVAEDETYTLLDIKDNPKNIEFVTLDRATLIQALDEMDACFINAALMTQGNLDPTKYIERDQTTKYALGLAVNKEDSNQDWVNDIHEAARSEEFENELDKIFNGAIVVLD